MAAKKHASPAGGAKGGVDAADDLKATLRRRFDEHPSRHPDLDWETVEARLDADVLARLTRMEETGGEPDVALIEGPGVVVFVDCAPQSPSGRRSLCYDDAALAARKLHKPAGSAVALAASLGIELLDEAQYRHLQTLGAFDTKTSSWLRTPPAIRKLGGALFGDRRYGQVFTYHNGAESYYAARGFRGLLTV